MSPKTTPVAATDSAKVPCLAVSLADVFIYLGDASRAGYATRKHATGVDIASSTMRSEPSVMIEHQKDEQALQ